MSNTKDWRINTLEKDISNVTSEQISNVGAMVVRSLKGNIIPKKIYKGNQTLIESLYGQPNATYPDVWEAIEYNKEADIWISAPNLNGKYGGVFVNNDGTESFINGLTSKTITDFSAITVIEQIGIGNGTTTAFSYTFTDFSHYVNQSVDILVGGTSIHITASDVATEVLTTSPAVGEGTLVRATGVLNFTFDTAPVDGAIITVSYTVDKSEDCYFVLVADSPYADDLSVKITYNSSLESFTVNGRQYLGNNKYVNINPFTFSLTEDKKDGFGADIYADIIFENEDINCYFNLIKNPAADVSTFTDDITYINLAGGSRGDTLTADDIQDAWQYFYDAQKYPADIFMDTTGLAIVATEFEALRGSSTSAGYQPYKAYLLKLPNSTAATAITDRNTLSLNNRGIYLYCNKGKVRYGSKIFWSSLIGKIGVKHAQMVDTYNGLAPMRIDENNHGGQLGTGIVELEKSYTQSELELLDTNGINAIVFSTSYGYYIESQKTSRTDLTDYSYIMHSRLADYLITNIIPFLEAQVGKLNDEFHRGLVKDKCEQILQNVYNPPYNLLRDYYVQCDELNNNDIALSQRKFKIYIYVQYRTSSEKVDLVLVNVGQTLDIEDTISMMN